MPWTKPENLHYAADELLPELGGLFRDVFQAAFADGAVYTLTKKYDEVTLRRFRRCAKITCAMTVDCQSPKRQRGQTKTLANASGSDQVILARRLITCNDREVTDLAKLDARSRRGRGATDHEDAALATWRQKNEELERQIARARQYLQFLKEARTRQRELKEQRPPPVDPCLEEAKRENTRLQTELRKIQAESDALAAEINRLQQPQKKGR